MSEDFINVLSKITRDFSKEKHSSNKSKNESLENEIFIINEKINSIEEDLKEHDFLLSQDIKDYNITIYNYFKNMGIINNINFILGDNGSQDFFEVTRKYFNDPLFKKYIDLFSKKENNNFLLRENIVNNIKSIIDKYKIKNNYDYILFYTNYILYFLNYIIDTKKVDLNIFNDDFINITYKPSVSLMSHLKRIYENKIIEKNQYVHNDDYKSYKIIDYKSMEFPYKKEILRSIYFDYFIFALNINEDDILSFNNQFDVNKIFDYMEDGLGDYFYQTYNFHDKEKIINNKFIYNLNPKDICKHEVNKDDDRKSMIDEIGKYYVHSLKKCIYGNNKMIEKLDDLILKYPNFKKVINYVKGSVKKSILSKKPLSFSPINLQGDPGIGKTYFANNLAEAIDMDSNFISIGSISNGFEISGMTNRYMSSNVGYFTDIVFNKTDNLQSVIILDELCKTKFEATHNGTSALPAILSALDRKTSKNFKDTFLEIKYDISNVFFISTTNDYSILPDPLKSRLINFNIEYPNKEEYKNIFFTILNEVTEDVKENILINIDYDEIYKDMSDVSPRDLNRIFNETLAMSILDDNNIVDGKYLINNKMIKQSIISMKENSNRAGFI